MPEEIVPAEPRKYRWIEFGDGVDGKILASSLNPDGSKRIFYIEVDPKILNELVIMGRLKRTEIIDENKLKVEIPKEYCTDMFYLSSNPKVRADCDFKGNPIAGITKKYQEALRMEREENRTLRLQVLSLQRDLREAKSDIERFVKKNWQVLAKPLIEDLKSIIPRGFPVTRIRKRELTPV